MFCKVGLSAVLKQIAAIGGHVMHSSMLQATWKTESAQVVRCFFILAVEP